jgi:hypothetical protein
MSLNLMENRVMFDFNDYPVNGQSYDGNYDELRATFALNSENIYPPVYTQ